MAEESRGAIGQFREGMRSLPLIFPFIGLAHVVWFLYELWLNHSTTDLIEWIDPLWMAAYSVCWLSACTLRRWGVWGYIALTIINICVFVFAPTGTIRRMGTSSLFLIDVAFTFLLLVYYKRFRR